MLSYTHLCQSLANLCLYMEDWRFGCIKAEGTNLLYKKAREKAAQLCEFSTTMKWFVFHIQGLTIIIL